MCGILGIKKIDFSEDVNHPYRNKLLANLEYENYKRGKASKVCFTTPQGTFYHFRAPTSGCDLNNLSEAYPLTYKGWGLIGNGVINEKYFKSIKDEDNNNDLYYILKNVRDKGYIFLEEVEGCFALAIFAPDGTILLVKNTFPLYYNNEIFSSVKFEGSKLLEDGQILFWNNMEFKEKLKLKDSPFLI